MAESTIATRGGLVEYAQCLDDNGKKDNEYEWLIRITKFVPECKNCRCAHFVYYGTIYVVHPIRCWWEKARLSRYRNGLECGCTYHDVRGTMLWDSTGTSPGTSFFTLRDLQIFRTRNLEVDYVTNSWTCAGKVTFVDLWDKTFKDDDAQRSQFWKLLLMNLCVHWQNSCVSFVNRCSICASYARLHAFRDICVGWTRITSDVAHLKYGMP